MAGVSKNSLQMENKLMASYIIKPEEQNILEAQCKIYKADIEDLDAAIASMQKRRRTLMGSRQALLNILEMNGVDIDSI